MQISVRVFANYQDMSSAAADMVAGIIRGNGGRAVLGLATGSTPVGMYERLADMNQRGEVDFSNVTTVNLDEYYPISPDNEQSYRFFMNQHLFNHINISTSNTYVPNGNMGDETEACIDYERILNLVGDQDIQILGIGNDGHIAFNEPSSALKLFTHPETLDPSTVKANARFFASEDEVPKRALTMGMASIMRAKRILLMANGESKQTAIGMLLDGRVTTACPATFLRLHRDLSVFCTADALPQRWQWLTPEDMR